MPNYWTSGLNALKKPDVPNLPALYRVLNPVPINPATEIMLTICPPPYFFSKGRNAFVTAIWEMQLVFSMYWHVLKSVLMNSSLMVSPALLITISTLLFFEQKSSTLLRHSSGLLRSSSIICTLDGSIDSDFTLFISLTFLEAIVTYLAPSCSNLLVSSSPIPLEPPVMKTDFPLKSSLTFFHLWYW